jgi:hypothetical protein
VSRELHQIDNRDTVSADDLYLRRFREYVTASFAAVLILGTVILLILAYSRTNSDEDFNRVKDLLLFINPLVGVALGYYFSKSTSQSAVDTAQDTAKEATAAVEYATRSRREAEAKVAGIVREAEETQEALSELVKATEHALAESTDGLLLSSSDESDPAGFELQLALKRAQRTLRR